MINEFRTRSRRRSTFFNLRHSLNLKERFSVLVLSIKFLVKLHTARQSVSPYPCQRAGVLTLSFAVFRVVKYIVLSETLFQFVIFEY
jgi:hypothetical protein